MAILFTGNTHTDFEIDPTRVGDVSTVAVNDGVTGDAAYVAEVMQTISDNNGLLVSAMSCNHAQPVGKMWVHMQMRAPGFQGDARLNGEVLTFFDSSNVRIASIDVNAGQYRSAVYGDTTVTGTNYAVTSFSLIEYDVSIEVTPTSVTVDMYANGTLVSSATAANVATGHPPPTKTAISISNMGFGAGFSGFAYISQFIITDQNESSIGTKLYQLIGATAGNYSQWTGALTTLFDNDTATALSIDSTGQRQSWNYTAPNYPAIFSVSGLALNYRGTVAGGVGAFRPFIRLGTTDYDNAATLGLDIPYSTTVVYTTNPATTSPWALSDFSTFQQGVLS